MIEISLIRKFYILKFSKKLRFIVLILYEIPHKNQSFIILNGIFLSFSSQNNY